MEARESSCLAECTEAGVDGCELRCPLPNADVRLVPTLAAGQIHKIKLGADLQ
jgi:hypothetical protein